MWAGIVVLLLVVGLLVAVEVVFQRAAPILKGRILETLSTRFDAKVELDTFDVSVLKGLEVSGGGLRIYPPNDVVAAGWTHPLFTVGSFRFRTNLHGLFEHPTRVGSVYVGGLVIDIPPREMRRPVEHQDGNRKRGKIKIAVDEILCEDSQLIVETLKPNKEPKVFQLKHIELRHVGPDQPWAYDAVLVNAIPRGDIHAWGGFGPWVTESPGDSNLTGRYTFDKADLNTIRGIGGMTSSTGTFHGMVNHIAVDGETSTPNFSLDSANHPMPLTTKFNALVDGTTGDTYLQQVTAKLGGTSFTTQGAIVNIKGQGHDIQLDVQVPAGRIQDFLQLAVKTNPPVVTGVFSTRTKLHIPPGKQRVMEKLTLQGNFRLRGIHFTNPKFEDKIDMLSLRAQGDPRDAKPGAQDVTSQMDGAFTLNNSRFNVSKLVYTLPGAHANLDGVYSLDGEQFDFHGQVFTQAKISKMVASGWKSFLLKAVDPFFKGENGGSQIPVHISGTKSEPKFGLDLHYKDESKINAAADKNKAK
ncbi:AsmA-like C-terminal region [Granulicella rosea]|uniref:AsmA-like C-terminal region n=1 Tax=Granulicella rosea TaxID=474952 RepID=A0A239EL30_9BACT|nr:AsmA-like C-terminal region-containing protein [Granulicella rosea]SNS45269.1 AsmA-like C-terminal region [Granulicella rosea]